MLSNYGLLLPSSPCIRLPSISANDSDATSPGSDAPEPPPDTEKRPPVLPHPSRHGISIDDLDPGNVNYPGCSQPAASSTTVRSTNSRSWPTRSWTPGAMTRPC